jgi:hypothetical protein
MAREGRTRVTPVPDKIMKDEPRNLAALSFLTFC